jgi:hypothetical protein
MIPTLPTLAQTHILNQFSFVQASSLSVMITATKFRIHAHAAAALSPQLPLTHSPCPSHPRNNSYLSAYCYICTAIYVCGHTSLTGARDCFSVAVTWRWCLVSGSNIYAQRSCPSLPTLLYSADTPLLCRDHHLRAVLGLGKSHLFMCRCRWVTDLGGAQQFFIDENKRNGLEDTRLYARAPFPLRGS